MMQFRVGLATAGDDAAIRGLYRNRPMPGRISVAFEREPNFSLGCRVTGEDCQIVVARTVQGGEIAGVACRSTRRVYLNGREQRIGYLGQLRIDERFRGRWLVSRGFGLLKQLHERDPLPAYLVSIVEGNSEATGVLVRNRRKVFPAIQEVTDFCTLAISVRGYKPALRRDTKIAGADARQLGEIAAFLRSCGARRQFFPVWMEEKLRELTALGLRIEDLRILRRGGEIVGIAGLWDQSSYKQNVVHGYSGWMKAAAPIYNLSAPWLGRATLPRPGEKLRSAYAAFVCVANDDEGVFAALMRELYNLARFRGFEYLLIGLDARDPLLPVAREYAHVAYPSKLYLAEWPGGGHIHEQLDRRLAYVDIATL
jgi:hypothetical protein